MPRLPLGILVLAVVAGTGSPARAQPTPSEQAEFRVVVEVRGQAALGRRGLSRVLRRTLADEIGGLRSSRAFRRIQRKLKIPEDRQTYPSRLALVAREIAADFVVFVRVDRPPGEPGIVAKGYLIAAADAEILHRETMTFNTPNAARAAGGRMAEAMVEAMRALPLPTIEPPDPIAPVAEGLATPPIEPAPTEAPVAPSDPPPVAIAPPTGSDPAETANEEPKTTRPPLPNLPSRLTEPMRRRSEPVREVAPSPKPRSSSIVQLRLTIGSGLVRDYALSSQAGNSALSYDLPPVFLAALAADFALPANFGIGVQGVFRTIAFEINADGELDEPGGFLVDGRMYIDYRIVLNEAVDLRPQIGLRVGLTEVDDHPSAAVLSSTAVIPTVGLKTTVGRGRGFLGHLGVDVGYVALFDERPTSTGDANGGVAIGVDLGVGYGIDDVWAVVLDGRLTYDEIGFSGSATRGLAADEAPAFRDASISIVDMTLSVGVVVSL